jgi:uncharacterized membrane protein
MNENENRYLVTLLTHFLRIYDVPYREKEVALVLLSSPSFPSVLSIVQTCLYFGLETKAYKADFRGLEKTESPAIVHLKENDTGKFVLVKKVTANKVICFDAITYQIKEIIKDEFCARWSGVLILSEKGLPQRQRKINQSKITNRLGVYGLTLLALSSLFLFEFQNNRYDSTEILYAFNLCVLKMAGIWLSINLLNHEFGRSSSSLDRFCHRKASFDCNKVLQSKASKIVEDVALADVGFVYFCMGFILLIVSVYSGLVDSVITFLFCLSVCCIPFISFSIGYQGFVVKKWCPLCLSVMGVIVLEVFLVVIFPSKITLTVPFMTILSLLLFSLAVSVMVLLSFKVFLREHSTLFTDKINALRFKRDPFILATLFKHHERTSFSKNNGVISIGNSDSKICITTLLNPLCPPCKRLVTKLMDIREKFPNHFSWNIRFDGVKSHEYKEINHIPLYLIEVCRNINSDEKKLEIIRDWYSEQSIEKFSSIYSLQEISNETVADFYFQCEENSKSNIKKVPAIWMNHYELPQGYSVIDIPFLMTDLNLLQQLTV